MMTTFPSAATNPQSLVAGSFGYSLEFIARGFNDGEPIEGRPLRVVVMRPDGTSFERTTPVDVEVLEIIDPETARVGMRVKEGDLIISGVYQYQLYDGKFRDDLRFFCVR